MERLLRHQLRGFAESDRRLARLLVGGVGSFSRLSGSARIHNSVLNGASATVQGGGGSYANRLTHFLPPSKVTSGAVCAPGPCGGSNGVVIVAGTPVSTGTPETVTVTGFPWTTGMVSAVVTNVFSSSTLTATGADARTALGSGQITLVAGGLIHRRFAGTFSSLDTIQITLAPRHHLPSFSPAGLAALATAFVLSMGYVHRRRSAGG